MLRVAPSQPTRLYCSPPILDMISRLASVNRRRPDESDFSPEGWTQCPDSHHNFGYAHARSRKLDAACASSRKEGSEDHRDPRHQNGGRLFLAARKEKPGSEGLPRR